MIDWTGKILLALIAAGVWGNIAISLVHSENATTKGDDELLASIASNVSNLEEIARKQCISQKLC